MNTRIIVTCFFLLISIASAQDRDEKIPILIRCDDWGMCHAVNMAAQKVLDAGFPVSASVMFACPWYQEAVSILKRYDNVSVGIHLMLNAEWKHYRWGPVLGRSEVPSLVDSLGYFFPTRALLFENHPKLSEIEAELRAQIERAIHSGLHIDYVDYHMGAAIQTPETRAIVEKLAAEYHLAVSRYFGEEDVGGWYATPIEHKLDSLLVKTKGLQQGNVKLLVFHIGLDDPEMAALVDVNETGPKQMSKHRQAELNALLSPKFQAIVRSGRFRLVNYGTLIREFGLSSMKRPME
jgi:predicted glycoside hydrolase/deacetylase ChbG (UPF0249 family)